MRPNSGDLYSGRKGAWALTQMRNFIEFAKVKLRRSLSGVVIVLRLRYTAPAVGSNGPYAERSTSCGLLNISNGLSQIYETKGDCDPTG